MRNGEQINFVAEWQAKGDHYVSYDNLLKLDNMMGSVQGKSKSDRTSLLSELSITYFARYAEASFAGQQCLLFDFDSILQTLEKDKSAIPLTAQRLSYSESCYLTL
jgi:hypothetical protein